MPTKNYRPLTSPDPSPKPAIATLNPNPTKTPGELTDKLPQAFLEAAWGASRPTDAASLVRVGWELTDWPLELMEPPSLDELRDWHARLLWGSLQTGRLRGEKLNVSETLRMIGELKGLLGGKADTEDEPKPPPCQIKAFPEGMTPIDVERPLQAP